MAEREHAEASEHADDGGEHDPEGPFFGAPPLDAEGDGKPIEVADTDEIMGGALADEGGTDG